MKTFPYKWSLADGYPEQKNGCKVFGTFICGGGSTMGYKLAGFDHLGGVEVDDRIAEVYRQNHHPKHLYVQDIREFNKRDDLPAELYNLDILDGSPPCSSFSMAGNREEDWGNEKRFNEGQALQRLDDLFFSYIETIGLLSPKVAVAENVTGLVQGSARAYVREIVAAYKDIGYRLQIFTLNAASMGVPQRRERIFFITLRNDFDLPPLTLNFDEDPVPLSALVAQVPTSIGLPLTDAFRKWWEICQPGRPLSKAHPKGSFFNSFKTWKHQVLPTITSTVASKLCHWSEPNELHEDILRLAGSFPQDYNFLDQRLQYIVGMSVPPVMMARVADQIYKQWLSKLLAA